MNFENHKAILRLAIPNILSNLSVPLISSVDTALMGYKSVSDLAAVGMASMIFNFIYWNFGFLRMSTTGITAQAYGAADRQGIRRAMTQSAILGLVIALLLLALRNPTLWASVNLLQIDAAIYPMVKEYVFIRFWAAPATFLLYAFMGWFFGMQNAVIPLIITIVSNAANLALSVYFVQNLQMGIAGVAWGTVLAQYIALLIAVVVLRLRYPAYAKINAGRLQFQWAELKRFLQVNGDIFLRTLALTFSFAFFYRQSSALGPLILGANIVMLQFINWMAYAIDGFAFAAESLVGRFKGGEDYERLKLTIQQTFVWSGILALIFAVIYFFFGDQLILLFTNEQAVLQTARKYLWLLALLPLSAFASYVWDGVYIGLTASKSMRDAMLISLAFYMFIYFGIFQKWGNNGLWISLILFLVSRAVVQHVVFIRRNLIRRF